MLSNVVLDRLHYLLLLHRQHLLELRQLLYLLMHLDMEGVVFFRRDARVAADHQIRDVFKVGRLHRVGVFALAQVLVGVLHAECLEQALDSFQAVYLWQVDGHVEQAQGIFALQLLGQRLHTAGFDVDLVAYA